MNKIKVYRSLMVIGSVLLLGATFTHAGGRDVKQVKVTSDKAPDCSTMASMLASATKGCKTNDEKAIGIYNFLRQMLYHKNYPNEKGGVSSLKLINVYGWSLCGGLHTVESSFWKELGWEYRYVGWSNPGHTTAEAFYDDSWHYLDTFLKFYAWRKDANAPGGRTIASQDDIQKNPDEILTNGFVYDKGRAVQYQKGATLADNPRSMAFLVCGDGLNGIKTGVNNNKVMGGSSTGKTSHQGIAFDDPSYSTDINLNLGYSLDLYWNHIPTKNKGWFWNGQKWEPGHSCGDKDYRNDPILGPIFEPYAKGPDGKRIPGFRRSYANGTLSFDLSPITPAILNSLVASENVKVEGDALVAADASKPASITIDLSGQAYIMIKGKGEGEGVDSFEVSIDDGATFVSADIADFTKIVLGKYKCQAKVTFKKLTSLKLNALVQHNQDALTYLVPGKNKITVSAMDAKALGENELVVTIAYRPGFREIDILEKVSSSAYEIAKAHNADWSSDPVYVRKRFKAKDL
ncbi:MAG: hypothetical protein KAI74_01990, partial [Kiritimatiellae bacterium]|nr:hypothetical protein [Kiritimatiellia bacterium]